MSNGVPMRLNDGELFLETKRALNPVNPDRRAYRRGADELEFRSAREQLADVSIVDETDTYLNLGVVLYAFVSLKDLPHPTFPGILRELTALDFPTVCNAQITIPDQANALKGYKNRLRKMQAAQWEPTGACESPSRPGRRGAVGVHAAGHHFEFGENSEAEPGHRVTKQKPFCSGMSRTLWP